MKGKPAGTSQKEEFLVIGFQRGKSLPDFVSNSTCLYHPNRKKAIPLKPSQ